MLDDGVDRRQLRSHCTMLTMPVLYNVQYWRVCEFSTYGETESSSTTILKQGKEQGKRYIQKVRATIPVPPVQGYAHVFVVLSFDSKIRRVHTGLEAVVRREPWRRSRSRLA